MATRIGQESNALEMLKNMIQRLRRGRGLRGRGREAGRTTRPAKEAFSAFKDDHQRHVAELGAIVRQEGDTPPSKGDMKRLLTEGKVVLAALAGDKAILRAMKSNEDDTNAAYERATGRTDLPVGPGGPRRSACPTTPPPRVDRLPDCAARGRRSGRRSARRLTPSSRACGIVVAGQRDSLPRGSVGSSSFGRPCVAGLMSHNQ